MKEKDKIYSGELRLTKQMLQHHPMDKFMIITRHLVERQQKDKTDMLMWYFMAETEEHVTFYFIEATAGRKYILQRSILLMRTYQNISHERIFAAYGNDLATLEEALQFEEQFGI